MFGQMMDQPLLISSILEFAIKFHGGVEVVTRTVEGPIVRSTWREVGRRATRLAHALTALGIGPGDRVATLAWNTQRHLELYFAVSGIGAVLHTINPRLSPEQLAYVVDDAQDALVFYDTTFAPLARLVEGRPSVRRTIALNEAEYEALLEGHPDTITWPALDERAASSLCYTSGTAGHPKGVVYSHRSTVLHSYAVAMVDALAISGGDVTLPVVPMFHVNAWGVPYAAAMVGSKLVLPGPGLDGASLHALIESERVTALLGVPTVWMNLLAHVRSVGGALGSVERVVVGGSAASPALIAAFEGYGARVVHAWGMTEMSPLGTANRLLPKHAALDSDAQMAIKAKQGRPLFGVDLRIVDDAGAALPHDGATSGHLEVRGPWVASGYFNQPQSDAHHDGWFATGDIATIDADGYMTITDRSKDVIKSGGEWISSIELENTAMGCPGVAAAAAVGLPHPKWVERPLLVVVRAPGAEVDAAQVGAHLAARLPKWWLPDAVEFVDALPLGATGKVLKRALRERFAGYTFAEPPTGR
ncbi:MAG: long-chain-fatty-acid--CoA ligase [Myxococcota bacterium]